MMAPYRVAAAENVISLIVRPKLDKMNATDENSFRANEQQTSAYQETFIALSLSLSLSLSLGQVGERGASKTEMRLSVATLSRISILTLRIN